MSTVANQANGTLTAYAARVADGIARPNPPLKVSVYRIRDAQEKGSSPATDSSSHGHAQVQPKPGFSLRVARDDLLVAGTKQRTAAEFTRIAISKREAAGLTTTTLLYTAPFNGFGPVAAAFTAKALGLKCKLILSRRPIGQSASLPTQTVLASENVKLLRAFGAELEVATSWLTLLDDAKKLVAEDPTVFWLPLGFKTADGVFSDMLAAKIRESLEQAEALEAAAHSSLDGSTESFSAGTAAGACPTLPSAVAIPGGLVQPQPASGSSSSEDSEPSTRNTCSLRKQPPAQVFVAGGTGALGVALSKVFPTSKIFIVPGNIDPKGVESIRKTVEQCDRKEQCVVLEKHSPAVLQPPFPTIAGYDQLAWDAAVELGSDGDFVWNVAGVPPLAAAAAGGTLPPARGRGLDRNPSRSGTGGGSTLDSLLGRKRERPTSPPAAREAA